MFNDWGMGFKIIFNLYLSLLLQCALRCLERVIFNNAVAPLLFLTCSITDRVLR